MKNISGNVSEKSIVDIGSRLELFADDFIVEALNGVFYRLHEPCPDFASNTPKGIFMTVIKEEELFRAYYRVYEDEDEKSEIPRNKAEIPSEERTCYEESRDGINWEKPELGICTKSRCKNALLAESPFAHNLSPFLDTRPGVPETHRFKALAGRRAGGGLYAFSSADGIHWKKISQNPVIRHDPDVHGKSAFDSQNVSFWSEAEGCYVAYFRHWNTRYGKLRTVGRAVSGDFVSWEDESDEFDPPNLKGEQLYTNQTHPYFRAPHIYIALPTRFSSGKISGRREEGQDGDPKNIGSTDILLMTSRAGRRAYTRLFKEAFIRPGLSEEAWGNRVNYAALNVVPTSPGEMSIYHRLGRRYTLRTDGFVSIRAAHETGECITRPFVFKGGRLILNVSTSVEGYVFVELQTPGRRTLAGFSSDECIPVVGDGIDCEVKWKNARNLRSYEGKPVRLRFIMKESDLYSFRFSDQKRA